MKKLSPTLLCTVVTILMSFPIASQTWEQMEKVTASLRGEADQFGISVALSGDYAIVGSYLEDEDASESNPIPDAGAAYIFKREDCDWVFVQKLVAADREMESSFGESVAMYGDYAVVCANQEDDDETGSNPIYNAGAVYVFKNINGTWTQFQKLVASDRGTSAHFGIRASISGNDLIVGAYQEAKDANGQNAVPGAGAAYIFKNINGTWYQAQKIVAAARDAHDNFGISVCIAGNMAVVGAFNDQQDANEANPLLACGSAYIFTNTGGVWSQAQKITNNDRNTFDRFGYSVGIGEDHVLVAANQEDHDVNGNNFLTSAGAVYSFQHNGTSWVQTQKLLPADRGAADFFGNTISISEDLVLISSFRDDEDVDGGNTMTDAGSAYIFKNINGTWSQHQKICAADRGASNFFGLRVAMSGDYMLLGANIEDEDETGQNTIMNAGAAYFFRNIDGESCEGGLDICNEINDLIAAIAGSEVPSGIQTSLTSKLNNAQNSYTNGQSNAAINKLNAFINEVEAQSGQSIPSALADDWIELVLAIIEAIESGEGECDENIPYATFNPGNPNVTDGAYLTDLTVSPNPGSTHFQITWNADIQEPLSIRLMDNSGRILSISNVVSYRGRNLFPLTLDDQSAGLYHIQLTSASIQQTIRLVKSDF